MTDVRAASPGSPDLLVVGRWLIADPGARRAVQGPVGVLVDGGAVVAIGPPDELRRLGPRDELGGERAGILPGLVNAHHHQSVTPFQRGIGDDQLEPWLASQRVLPLLDPVLDTWWGAVEMMRAGITTVVHNHAAAWLPAVDPLGAARSVVDVYMQAGMRVAFSVSARDQHPIVYDDQPALSCADQPVGIGACALDARSSTSLTRAIAERVAHDRIRVQVSPHNVQWCSDEMLIAQRHLASELGTGLHLHVQETSRQLEYGHRQWGCSPLRHLDDLGFLGPDVTCAHAVWLDPGDADLLAERGVTVGHNPSSNLRLQSGIAPVARLLHAGVVVALGLDQAGLNDDQDPFTELRVGLRLARLHDDAGRIDAHDALALATTGGASASGFSGVGRIAMGGPADLVVVDLERASSPWLHPDLDPVDVVVHRVQARDVVDVVIDGVVHVRGGVVVGVDVDELRAELAARLERDMAQTDLAAGRRLADAVRRWFDDWCAVTGER